jgi:outer membrane lipoprotein carrier protein
MKRSSFAVLFLAILILSLSFLSTAIAAPTKKKSKGAAPTQKSQSLKLEDIENLYKTTSALEANFIQEVYQASLGRTKTSSGSITLAKPNRVRWETYKPDASVMVSNGLRLWYYTPAIDPKGKGQVLVHPASELNRQPIYKILTGQAALTKEFALEKIEPAPVLEPSPIDTQVKPLEPKYLYLKPRQTMKDIQSVRLLAAAQDAKYLISEILIQNKNGNSTKISLQNITLGAKLPTSLFDFKPPPGSEIIKSNE